MAEPSGNRHLHLVVWEQLGGTAVSFPSASMHHNANISVWLKVGLALSSGRKKADRNEAIVPFKLKILLVLLELIRLL